MMNIPKGGDVVMCTGSGHISSLTTGKMYQVIARYVPASKIYITDDDGQELAIEYPVDTFRLCHFAKVD